MSEIRQFRVVPGGTKSQAVLTDELCQKIKDLVYNHADQMSVALAIGILHVAAKEILDEQYE